MCCSAGRICDRAMGLLYVLLLASVLMASIEAAHSATLLPIAINALDATNEYVKALKMFFCDVSSREKRTLDETLRRRYIPARRGQC